MPIYLDVQPRLDDRAARQVSDQADKHFSDAGKSAAQQFSKAISDGLSSSDAAVRKSADNTEKAYKKAADAAGLVRVEEAKLDDLRSKGSGGTAMLTQSERLDKARRAEISTARTALTAFKDLDTAQRSAASSGSLLAGVLQGVVQEASGTRIGGIASAIEGIGTKGIVAAAGVGALAVGIGAATKAVYDLGAQWDSISDSLTVRTGKIGSDLKGLTDVVGDIGSITAAPLGSIGEIVGQLSQSMPGLAENRTALLQMGSDLAFLDAHGQSVNIRELGKAFSAFNVNAADQVKTLDELNNVSQKTGIPINNLISTVQSGAPQFKQFGLNMGESTALMAAFEDGGLNADGAISGLRIALKNLGSDSRGPQKALADTVEEIKKLYDAGQSGAAQDLAKQVFGADNFAPFLDAIESGRVNVEGLKKALDDTGLSIANMQQLTDDGAQGWQKLTNTLKTELKPVADGVFGAINANVQLMTGRFNDWLSTLTPVEKKLADAAEHMKDIAAVQITPDSALGKMLLPGGGLPGTAGTPLETGLGSGARSVAVPGPATGPSTWGPRGGIFANPSAGGGTGRGPKLPAAPAVAYDTSLPTGFAGVPQTSEIVGAENSWMDARHTLAEKQARLDQLEKDNNATADDITKARNDVINAQQGQNQTELRLYDARQSLYDKETKKLKGHTDALGEFGAKLDQDFGISKGLPGIAENLTKFLGNLIAAPFLSQMSAISDASPSKGGFGLMGILGAQGAFGPQFTGIDYSKQQGGASASAMGPSAYGGGMAQAGTAMPGESARDFAHRVEMPFWQSQGYQVGDHAADKYGEHQNGALDIMVGSIAEGNKVLQQVLSDPNVYGAIFNNQTYGYGHGTTPQPYGSTGGPTDKHEDHVHAWYRPGNSGDITPLPGGAQPGSPAGTASTPGTLGSSGVVPVSVTNWPGAALGGSGPGQPPGQGPGAPQGAPGSGLNWDALAAKESGGNWGINTGNGYSGGLQFDPSTWAQYGGTQYAPSAGEATKDQQIAVAQQAYDARGGGATLWPQNYGQLQAPGAPGTWGGPGLPAGITGGGGQSPVFGASPQGPGLGASATAGILGGPGVGGAAGGPGVGPTTIGGVEPPKGSGQGGIGITPGGSIDTALGVAASMFPGLGQAAQTGVKLASRAIQYGGQVAGIATQGVMDTFLPTGGSELANHSWLSKIVGGLAGAAPALPNMAGKPAAPPAKDGSPASGQGQGPPPGPPNITVNNNRATEDGTGRDVAYHMQNMYQPAGQP